LGVIFLDDALKSFNKILCQYCGRIRLVALETKPKTYTS